MNGKAVSRQLALMVILVVVAIAALIWSGRKSDVEEPVAEGAAPIRVHVMVRTDLDTILNVDMEEPPPVSALAALEAAARSDSLPLGIKEYDFGKLVFSIGGRTAGDDGDWTYKVNGEFMPVAADACQLAEGDRLEFRFGAPPEDSL
jgi:hypothetical protein